MQCQPEWQRFVISDLEDLSNGVLDAGLEVTQMDQSGVRGSLCFLEMPGVVISSGYIDGSVCLKGSLSEEHVTIGIAVELGEGSRHWLTEVSTGQLAVWMPGDDHDAFYSPGSLYVAVSIGNQQLESAAADIGVVLDRHTLGGTGIHAQKLPERAIASLRSDLYAVHGGSLGGDEMLHTNILDVAIQHYARDPRPDGPPQTAGLTKVVARARDYIQEHLRERISVDAIAAACCTSRRTLHRAFVHVLDETPYAYVNRLRLHRIRHDLASVDEAQVTIASAANRWGIGELGRLSDKYRHLFGECPSKTLARRHSSL